MEKDLEVLLTTLLESFRKENGDTRRGSPLPLILLPAELRYHEPR